MFTNLHVARAYTFLLRSLNSTPRGERQPLATFSYLFEYITDGVCLLALFNMGIEVGNIRFATNLLFTLMTIGVRVG